MTVLIIEDEVLAAELLKFLLQQYDPSITVVACLESIEDAVQWLQTKAAPDLLFMDIHLSDGDCFEIFKQVPFQKPVIFTTAFDKYAIHAFQHYSVDYILKPVTASALAAAINKLRSMSAALTRTNEHDWFLLMKENIFPRYKERFLAKVGQRSFFIQTEDIAFFSAENKIVSLADITGNRFIINYTIEKLEPLLHPEKFFRVNRKMIVHSKVIEQAKPHYNHRLKLFLKNIKMNEDIIISRERVPAFKKWAEG